MHNFFGIFKIINKILFMSNLSTKKNELRMR